MRDLSAVLVAALTGRALLDRRAHLQHHHVLELHLTDRGNAALADAETVVRAVESEIRHLLGQDADTLKSLLDRVAGHDGATDA